MEWRFKLSVRNALIATAWVAAWFANIRWLQFVQVEVMSVDEFLLGEAVDYYLSEFLLVGIPAAAAGAITGRHWQGISFGAISGLAFIVYEMYLM